jgi:hypothetical protein
MRLACRRRRPAVGIVVRLHVLPQQFPVSRFLHLPINVRCREKVPIYFPGIGRGARSGVSAERRCLEKEQVPGRVRERGGASSPTGVPEFRGRGRPRPSVTGFIGQP